MNTVSVICPECGYQRRVGRAQLPPRRVHATCPECGLRFPFAGHLEQPVPPPLPAEPVAFDPPAAPDAFDAQTTFDPFPDEPPAAPPPRPPLVPQAPPAPPPPPVADSTADDADDDAVVVKRFTFSGSPGEYFGIWIVNLLLKIVTFGLYSAWAKVRKRRYFYGNTQLDGTPFDYTADPLAIFRGWCIGAALFVVYSLAQQVSPVLGLVCAGLFYLAIPWLIVRSHLFNQRNSLHRNIRFTFNPDYRGAYLVFAGLPLLIPLTLGMLTPYVLYRQKKFLVENSSYGTLRFSFLATAGDFYRFFFKVGVGALLIVALLFAAMFFIFDPLNPSQSKGGLMLAFAPLLVLGIGFFYFFIVIYVQTGLTNLTWNTTFLGEAWFVSSLRTRDMAWLYLSSAVAIVCSCGLLVPWAAVRLARYRCEHMEVAMPADLRSLARQAPEVGAGGEEIGDIFGVDVGL